MNKPSYAKEVAKTTTTGRIKRTTTLNVDNGEKAPIVKKKYLTKRVLLSAVRRAFKAAAAETMAIQGYNVIADDGWVVKIYADGTKEKMTKMEHVPRPEIIILK